MHSKKFKPYFFRWLP